MIYASDRVIHAEGRAAPVAANLSPVARDYPWNIVNFLSSVSDIPAAAEGESVDEDAVYQAFVDWVGMVKFLSPEDPGPSVIRRLTKAEHGNTLHDLFGVDPAVVAELPDDVPGQGYLNTRANAPQAA